MIRIELANEDHVQGIISVCRAGYCDVSKGLLSHELIEQKCEEYYKEERIRKEVTQFNHSWGGYFVALEGGIVVGAGGGGMTTDQTGWLYVLYLNPTRRNEGIGTKILEAVTEQQKQLGALEQYVTVQKGNMKGIPFYEARGFVFQEEIQSKDIKQKPGAIVLKYRRELD
ncbi:hypothetical conserved protein [Oceanobacillus iheyensis HTE831]|uniref:Hypothetical conserved protein n=1 Tax=Oceanobacillus iheyensis (strain DSM 14371 / CIP 107618 / JCM 11309 / KCTC 3954 / HTE831) TaxID=221109 RepID=Q8EN77_OCEIH|nr:GNAT family N-acetyltransferase [Oceanobacillus iheyensis]BAC14566.1 hypothetical conserved protein [Oceanobacillus iheyensis HTE831]